MGLKDGAGLDILVVLLVGLISWWKVDDFFILSLDVCDFAVVGVGVKLAGVMGDVVELGVCSGPERQLVSLAVAGCGVRRTVVSGQQCGHPRTCLIVNYITVSSIAVYLPI